MSFNAPFTTQSYYSWLFDKDASGLVTPTNLPQKSTSNHSFHETASGSLNGDRNSFSTNSEVSTSHHFPEDDIHLLNGEFVSPSDDVPAILASMHMQTEPNGMFKSLPKDQDFRSLHASRASEEMRYGGYLSTISSQSPAGSTFNSQSPSFQAQSSSYGTSDNRMNSIPRSSQVPEANHNTPNLPPDAHPVDESTQYPLPQITEEARDNLMFLIGQYNPTKPDFSPITASEPLLGLKVLQRYSDLFFTRFNSSYPLIHQPTFEPSHVHPFLLMAILLLGATYSDKESHLLAVCLHDIMRPLIHSSKEFSAKPKLWMLQTILLVECFGKSRAGEKQHDMSHLYHGLLIKYVSSAFLNMSLSWIISFSIVVDIANRWNQPDQKKWLSKCLHSPFQWRNSWPGRVLARGRRSRAKTPVSSS